MVFSFDFREFPGEFSANILIEYAPLGFSVMAIFLEVIELFTAQSLIHPAVITLATNPDQLLPRLLSGLIW